MSEKPQITDDTPLPLKLAAELAFADGGTTASGLRKEAGNGRLVIERIAGKEFTTLGAIEEKLYDGNARRYRQADCRTARKNCRRGSRYCIDAVGPSKGSPARGKRGRKTIPAGFVAYCGTGTARSAILQIRSYPRIR